MKSQTYFSVVGYRKGTTYILAENASFDDALEIFEKRGEQFETMNIVEEKIVESVPKNLLVVANAEGMLEETRELLDRPLKLGETFVFLGNYTAGGPGFYTYMNYLSELRRKRKCIFVKGRNEHNLLECIHGTKRYIGDADEVATLLDSIECELSFKLKDMPRKFPAMYALLSDAVDFFENDAYIFVSGGLDLTIPYWKESGRKHFFTTTEDFLLEKNETGKKIVFGDIPVTELTVTQRLKPWLNHSMDKLGINGGCRQGGKLYGFVLLDEEESFLGIRSKKGRLLAEARREEQQERERNARWSLQD